MSFGRKRVDTDPVAAEQNSAEEKWCTHCGIKKPLKDFHRDARKEDGHRDVCIECRAKIDKDKEKESLDARLKELEQEGIETLGKLTSGGSFDPHINQVFESMLRPFGGVDGWAKHLFATYLAAPPGSQKRVKIHDMMMNLAGKVSKLGLAERQLESMEERDLLNVMRQNLIEYQKGNNLLPTEIPTLDGEVVDVSKEDSDE